MKRNSPRTKPEKVKTRSRVKNRELAHLYMADETAWLERTAELIHARRYDELDYQNLAEYLVDMARRDRREVLARLTTLLAHRLKWDHQPDMRTSSWAATMRVQRFELEALFESQTLRKYADEILGQAYSHARKQALAETALPETRFPTECPYTFDELLAEE